MSMAETKTIRIRQVKSGICCPDKQKRVLHGLGFRRRNEVIERPDTPGVRGMIFKVRHLVEVLE
jgi:large subunit ribosomal protein L30